MKTRNQSFIFFLSAAVALIAGGLFWTVTKYATVKKYEKTTGNVIEMARRAPDRYDPDRDIIYYPKIRYEDGTGRVYLFESNLGSEQPRMKVGDTVALLFNPADPNDIVIDSFFHLWLGPTLLIGAGCAVLAIAIVKRRGGRSCH